MMGTSPERGLWIRAVVVLLCIGSAAGVLARNARSEAVPPRESLAGFPMTLDAWQGQPLPDFEKKILDVLGVDEYVNRMYAAPGEQPVALYVGYYQSQRQGDTMHSPLNCLPGAGWLPVRQGRRHIPVVDAQGNRQDIEVNDFTIEKGLDRQVVLYWYQSHGRVVASEYWGKIYTVADAVRLNRSDGALVRLVAPVRGSGPEAERAAQQAAVDFASVLFTRLGRYLPV
jgi:EpsI family protein